MKDKEEIKRLRVGDIVIVSNPIFKDKEYVVKRIEGNKAHTDFRVFNTKIYRGTEVFEYGNKDTTNSYYTIN